MSSKKRASLSNNSPLDQLFSPGPPGDERRETPAPEPETRPAPAPEPAPPAEEAPALRQTTIMIYEDQSDWLDEACYRARRDSGSIVSKAAIIRALVDLAREYDVRFADTQSDDEIRERLKQSLGLRR